MTPNPSLVYAPMRLAGPLCHLTAAATKTVGACLDASSRVLVSGPAGTGKSMLTRWLTVGMAQRHSNTLTEAFPDAEALPTRVQQPLRVALWRLNQRPPVQSVPDFLRVALEFSLIPECHFASRHAHTLQALANGELCLILDGLDDVATTERQEAFARVLEKLEHTPSTLLLTLREWPTWFLHPQGRPVHYEHLQTAPLSPPAQVAFIEQWYQPRFAADPEAPVLQTRAAMLREKLAASAVWQALATVPLHLLAMVFAHGRTAPLRDEAYYYTAIIEAYLDARPTPNPATVDEIIPQLAALYADGNVIWEAIQPREELLGRLWKCRKRSSRPTPMDRRSPDDFLTLMGYVGLLRTPAMSPEYQHDADGWGFQQHLRGLYDWIGEYTASQAMQEEPEQEPEQERRYEPAQETMRYGTM